jgi:phytoene dehydrogenase-like protein
MSDPARSAQVIVVGAGHNGLACACYLARAGIDVLVLEAADQAGGCTTTAPLVAEAPEHLLSACAADIITMRASSVLADLELARHGFQQVEIDPSYVSLAPDGASLAFWRDPQRTAAEIRRFSALDARVFLETMASLQCVLDAALPLVSANPVRPGLDRLLRAVAHAARHPRAVAGALTLAGVSAEQAICERFRHPVVRGALAMLASFASPITGEGTGVALMIPAAIARFGMSRPVGGMGALPAALQRCLGSHGGRVRTGAEVEEIIVRGGAAAGVRLAGGESIRAEAVVAATEPHRALTRLLPAGALPVHLEERARRIPSGNDGCTHFKVELALRGRLALSRHARRRGDGVELRGPSAMVGSLEEVVAAIGAAQAGRVSESLPFVSMIPTAADPSQAPAGQDTLSLWSGWLPHKPRGGWEKAKSGVERRMLAHAAQYYDGLEELEIGRWVESPEDISARTGVRDGNVYHVDVTLTRTGPLRPALGLAGYRTALPGFYLTGAGTHPGPSVSGIPGQLAARTLLGDRRAATRSPRAASTRRAGVRGGPEREVTLTR